MKPVQLLMKVNTTTEARVGLAGGMMMRQQIPNSLEPSMRAASAKARGRDLKKLAEKVVVYRFCNRWLAGTLGATEACDAITVLLEPYLRDRSRVHVLIEQGGAHER